MKELIFEPTQTIIDENLLNLVLLVEKYKSIYREQKELELFFEKATDQIVNDKDENGKKIYTYPANAKAKINEDNRNLADRLEEVWIQRKELEIDIEMTKMLHYHASKKIEENRQVDVATSIAGKNEEKYNNDDLPF